MRRIELLTPCLQGRCSPSWATPPYLFDQVPRNPASLPLSRCSLSIRFTRFRYYGKFDAIRFFSDVAACSCTQDRGKNSKCANLVGLSGLEPPTSRLSGVRSNRLSYRPMQGFDGLRFQIQSSSRYLLWMYLIHSKMNSTGLVSTYRNLFGFSSYLCPLYLSVFSRSDWISFCLAAYSCTQGRKKFDMNRKSP